LTRAYARERDRSHQIADEAGDGATRCRGVGQRDLRIKGRRGALEIEADVGRRCEDGPQLGGHVHDGHPSDLAGRQRTASTLCVNRGVGVSAAQAGLGQALADRPTLEPVQLDRECILDDGVVARMADLQALREKRADGVADELDEVVEIDHRPVERQQWSIEERRRCPAVGGDGAGAARVSWRRRPSASGC
jgi:hypothetical protein